VRVVVASSNPGKAREIQAILSRSGLELVAVPMWMGEEETGVSYLDNARRKAAAAVRLTALPVLAEDAGLEVDALGGLPGPRSARFSGAGDDANNAKLLRLLTGVPDARRTARYRAVAVLRLPSAAEAVGEGIFEGSITTVPRGSGGFGYDPLFVPQGEGRTVAELDPRDKDAISHRGRALRRLVVNARAAGLL
jgi:XTP/dITP diphosphohydrolase